MPPPMPGGGLQQGAGGFRATGDRVDARDRYSVGAMPMSRGGGIPTAGDLTGGDWQTKPQGWATGTLQGDPMPGTNGLPDVWNSGQSMLAQYLLAGELADTMSGAGGKLTEVGGQGSTDLGKPSAPAGAPEGDFLPPLGAGAAPPKGTKPSAPPLVSAEPKSSGAGPLVAVGAVVLALLFFS